MIFRCFSRDNFEYRQAEIHGGPTAHAMPDRVIQGPPFSPKMLKFATEFKFFLEGSLGGGLFRELKGEPAGFSFLTVTPSHVLRSRISQKGQKQIFRTNPYLAFSAHQMTAFPALEPAWGFN